MLPSPLPSLYRSLRQGVVRALAGAMIDDGRGWTITALRLI